MALGVSFAWVLFTSGATAYVAHCGDDHLDVETVVLKARREKRRSRQARKSGDAEETRRA